MSSPSPIPREERDKLTMARVAWLQSLTSHRIVTISFARTLYERCCAITHASFSLEAYDSMLEETTQHLYLLDLELRRYKDQVTGKAMLALVNTKADKLIQGATRYSAQEISFLKKFIEEVFKAKKEAFSLPSMEAIRLGSKLRSAITQNAADELLKNLVDHQWIELSDEGIYTLSTRSLLELRNYLRNEFGDDNFHTCSHCKDVITVGLGCSHSPRSCQARYHMHCARVVIGAAIDDDDELAARAGFPCPECRKPWKSRPIGPKVWQLTIRGTGEDNDEFGSSQRNNDQSLQYEQDDDDDLPESDQLDSQRLPTRSHRSVPTDPTRVVKSELGNTPLKRQPYDDDEEEDDEGHASEDYQDVKPQRLFD